MKHFWFGKMINDDELENEIKSVHSIIPTLLSNNFSTFDFLDACEKLSLELKNKKPSFDIFFEELNKDMSKEETLEIISEISDFLSKDHLRCKLSREVSSDELNDLARISFDRNIFEAWSPLGIITHIAPGNAPALSFLAMIEGLLSGNKNILKLSSKDSDFCIKAMIELCNHDRSKKLQSCNAILRVSSSRKYLLQSIINISDGVSAWGGDEAIRSVQQMLPAGVRFVPWGHKISFALVCKSKLTCNETIKKMAADCILMEQQACSSPQTILVETFSREEIELFSRNLLNEMVRQSESLSDPVLTIQDQAEITNISEVVRLESVLGKSKLLQSEKLNCRVYIDYSEGLSLSPLNRSIWVRPIKKENLVSSLFPLRQYLQTCGLSCDPDEISPWATKLIQSGVLRITNPGEMLTSYEGEPHDGVYALNRFMKRVRCEHSSLEKQYRLSSLENIHDLDTRLSDNEIMTKEDFQKQVPSPDKSKLYFRSGGSSGKPAVSTFSYEDYHSQMQAAAEGLFAAGLNPKRDRVMNLFFGGSLYGGFISFWTILEKLKAVQFPMQAVEDTEMVAHAIVENNVDVIIGMPSYILGLFKNNKAYFKEYRVIKKIFYGGEHLLPEQKKWLSNEFGVEVIRAASYGSVDAGPLGFQCEYMNGSEYHLNHSLHLLEILALESDEVAKTGEVGRLIFSSMKRDSETIDRYDVGDLGISLPSTCPCGRKTKRFQLMGRSGDIFRASGTFFNYQKFNKILNEEMNYTGELQIKISKNNDGLKDKLTLFIDRENINTDADQQSFFKNYKDLEEAVLLEECLDFEICTIDYKEFVRVETSGKLRRVMDLR